MAKPRKVTRVRDLTTKRLAKSSRGFRKRAGPAAATRELHQAVESDVHAPHVLMSR